MKYNVKEFVEYLENTLIPDLRESGRNFTASDFDAAVLFLRGAKEVNIEEMEVICTK